MVRYPQDSAKTINPPFNWAYNRPTPGGLCESGSPASPKTVNVTPPLQSRCCDTYWMGSDLGREIGIPDEVNYDIRLGLTANVNRFSITEFRQRALRKMLTISGAGA